MDREKDRQKFIELAEKRVTKVIKGIRLIGNLSNKSNYFYTDEDIKKILKALRAETKFLQQRFQNQGNTDESVFRL